MFRNGGSSRFRQRPTRAGRRRRIAARLACGTGESDGRERPRARARARARLGASMGPVPRAAHRGPTCRPRIGGDDAPRGPRLQEPGRYAAPGVTSRRQETCLPRQPVSRDGPCGTPVADPAGLRMLRRALERGGCASRRAPALPSAGLLLCPRWTARATGSIQTTLQVDRAQRALRSTIADQCVGTGINRMPTGWSPAGRRAGLPEADPGRFDAAAAPARWLPGRPGRPGNCR
jgi:hypothetical protein